MPGQNCGELECVWKAGKAEEGEARRALVESGVARNPGGAPLLGPLRWSPVWVARCLQVFVLNAQMVAQALNDNCCGRALSLLR